MNDQAATRPGPRQHAASKRGPKPLQASEEGWRELATRVRYEIVHQFKCDSIRDFSATTGFPERTLARVLNFDPERDQPVGINTLLRLEKLLKWPAGTAMRHLQGPPDEKPTLKGENEKKLWAALNTEETAFLTARDRAAFLGIFRTHQRERGSNEQSG